MSLRNYCFVVHRLATSTTVAWTVVLCTHTCTHTRARTHTHATPSHVHPTTTTQIQVPTARKHTNVSTNTQQLGIITHTWNMTIPMDTEG